MASPSPAATLEVTGFGSATSIARALPIRACDRNRYLIALQQWGAQAIDLATVSGVVVLVYRSALALRFPPPARIASTQILALGVVVGLVFVLLLDRHGAYQPCRSLLGVRDTERILRVTLQSFLLAALAAYYLGVPVSGMTAVLALVAVPLAVIVEKWHFHQAISLLRMQGHGMRRTIVVGAGTLGWETYSTLMRSPEYGLQPVAVVDDDPGTRGLVLHASSYDCSREVTVEHAPISTELLGRNHASAVVVAKPTLSREAQAALIAQLSSPTTSVFFVAENFCEPGNWIDHTEIDGLVLAQISSGQTRLVYELLKRTTDITLSLAFLALSAPLLALMVVLVRWTSPGPFLFWQERLGKDGHPFRICKVRTMYCDSPAYASSPTGTADPRLTRVGRILRRCSLDELPQLFNVVRGDMSLVGPRPEMAFKVAHYTPLQRQRLAVRPGLTGLWQISGDRKNEIHHNMEYDLYYLTNNPRFVWNVALQLSGIRRYEISQA